MKAIFGLVILQLASLALCSDRVQDFAPIKIGSKWEYSYHDQMYNIAEGLVYIDSLMISIEIASISRVGDDSLIILKNTESGYSVTHVYTEEKGNFLDTNYVDSMFIDTVIITEGNITKGQNYKGRIFPYWSSHEIVIDSLDKGTLNSDTLYFYNKDYKPCQNQPGVLYIQNIGLYSYQSDFCTHHTRTLEIKLSHYNENKISLSTKNNSKSVAKNVSSKCSSEILVKRNSKKINQGYLINGKKISEHKLVPRGIIMKKDSE